MFNQINNNFNKEFNNQFTTKNYSLPNHHYIEFIIPKKQMKGQQNLFIKD